MCGRCSVKFVCIILKISRRTPHKLKMAQFEPECGSGSLLALKRLTTGNSEIGVGWMLVLLRLHATTSLGAGGIAGKGIGLNCCAC